MMVPAHASSTHDDFFDFLLKVATPEQILAYRPSEAAQARAIELLEKNSEGTLTGDEHDELQKMRETDRMVSILKARAITSNLW
jgi:hypothetical protein